MKCAFCSTEVEFEIEKDGRYCPACGVKQPIEKEINEIKEVNRPQQSGSLNKGMRIILYVAWTIISFFILGIAAMIRESVRRPIGEFFFSFLDMRTAATVAGAVISIIIIGALAFIVLGYLWIRKHSKAQK